MRSLARMRRSTGDRLVRVDVRQKRMRGVVKKKR